MILEFDGSVAMLDDAYDILLSFNAPKNDFKSFLSLIPTIYSKDFKSLKTSGKLGLSGSVKGQYAENIMPSFNIKLLVEDGTFQYPDLPAAVTNVNISAEVDNITGLPDNTKVDVNTFNLKIGDNPVDIRFHLTNQ